MAERNSTSKARPGRKTSDAMGADPDRTGVTPVAEDAPRHKGDLPERTRQAVEAERTRLMQVDAVLGAVAFALDYAEWRAENGTEYASAVQVARDLLQESIAQLDPVSLERHKDKATAG